MLQSLLTGRLLLLLGYTSPLEPFFAAKVSLDLRAAPPCAARGQTPPYRNPPTFKLSLSTPPRPETAVGLWVCWIILFDNRINNSDTNVLCSAVNEYQDTDYRLQSLWFSSCWSALFGVPQSSWSVSTCDPMRCHQKQGQAFSFTAPSFLSSFFMWGNSISQLLLWLVFIWNVTLSDTVTLPQGTIRGTTASWHNMGEKVLGKKNVKNLKWNIIWLFMLNPGKGKLELS